MLTKMIGEEVVKSMNKYRHMMEKETFKKYARECTNVLLEKEQKKENHPDRPLKPFSDEKKGRIKVFVKEFTHKALDRLKRKKKFRKVSSDDVDHRHSPGGSSLYQPSEVDQMAESHEVTAMDIWGDDESMEPLTGRSVDTVDDTQSPFITTPDTLNVEHVNLARTVTADNTPSASPQPAPLPGFAKGGFVPVIHMSLP